MPAPVTRQDPPTCETCGNTRLHRHGTSAGKQCYYCKPCRRTQCGYPVPLPRPDKGLMPCPKCDGKTYVTHNHGNRNQLLCPKCNHHFTDLYRYSPPARRRSDGHHRHHIRFGLDPDAALAMDYYCQQHKMSPAQVIRRLLQTQADNAAELPDPETPLVNQRPDRLARMHERLRNQHLPAFHGLLPFYNIKGYVSVNLTDRQKSGLLILMQTYDTDQLNAVRRLLADRLNEYLAQTQPARDPLFDRLRRREQNERNRHARSRF